MVKRSRKGRHVKVTFIRDRIKYTGRELRSHYAYRNFDILGNSLIAFCGGCDVRSDDLVDLADAKTKADIYSEEMLHFIGEFFGSDLEKTILRQRLLMAILRDEIEIRAGIRLLRVGDDLYEGDRKITVSIATSSPVSTMIHAGVNILSEFTPVKTKGLSDYGIEPQTFAEAVLAKFKKEMEGVAEAACKVRGVD